MILITNATASSYSNVQMEYVALSTVTQTTYGAGTLNNTQNNTDNNTIVTTQITALTITL